ncbi:MAG: gas vesicle protein GvpR [Candidatus Zhuqueibacterota bacterium]
MAVAKVVASVVAFFNSALGKNGRVVEVKPVDSGWSSIFESIEETEYMRKIAQDDMVAVYDVQIDSNYEVVGYSRKSMRPRKEST